MSEATRNDKIVVTMWKGASGRWYWRAQHKSNRKIMADSGEGYVRKQACLNGIKAIFHAGVDVYEEKQKRDGSTEDILVHTEW